MLRSLKKTIHTTVHTILHIKRILKSTRSENVQLSYMLSIKE